MKATSFFVFGGRLNRLLVSTVLLLLASRPFASAQNKDVLTYHNNNARTGQYTNETLLTPANVNSTSFGKLWFLNADAHVDAEPLYAGGVLIPGIGYRNVAILVTENDSVYAYDANSTNLFWHATLLGPGETASDDRDCSQVAPIIGITSAPVIDRQLGANGTLFAVAMSKNSSSAYFQRLYALDLATGARQMPPVTITGSYPGTGANSSGGNVIFDPSKYKERAGLLLLGGVIYTAWASHCDSDPYTGWIMGYDEQTLEQVSIINVTPNASRGAIWMGNTAMAADSSSNIVFLDANGIFDATLNAQGFPINNDYGNAFLKIATSNGLAVADYFETSNTVSQSSSDTDLGSGGAIVLPSMTDTNGVSHQLAVGAGKDANIYIVDLANMGKFNPSNNSALYQEVTGALGASVFSMPAYFNGTLYYCANGDNLRAFPFANARLGALSSKSAGAAGSTGATPSVSANGSSNGIVWVVKAASSSPAVLYAFAATNLAVQLYNNTQAAGNRDGFGGGNKYATPMIANGQVYVGATNGAAVFGLLSQPAPVSVQSLVFAQQPANTVLGATIMPEVQVQALSAASQPIVGAQITLSLTNDAAALGGTTARTTDSNGIAHFNDLTVDEAGANVLTATPGFGVVTATANSSPFTVLPPPPSQTFSGATVNADGSVTLVYATTAGYSYTIQTATNLLGTWTNVPGSMTNSTGTSVSFTDTTSASSIARFYRVVSP